MSGYHKRDPEPFPVNKLKRVDRRQQSLRMGKSRE